MLFASFLSILAGLGFFSLHLTQPGSFPRPLSAEEERRCLAAIASGDAAARATLIEHNLRLVAHIIKKYYATAREQEDLISIGTIGLIKAVATYDSAKGARFATYAARCIENEILMQFRSRKKFAQDLYILDPIDTDADGNALTLMDIIADADSIHDRVDRRLRAEALRRHLRERLDPRERSILAFRYGLTGARPLTQRETAARLGISRSYVSRLESRALKKLREAFAEADGEAPAP